MPRCVGQNTGTPCRAESFGAPTTDGMAMTGLVVLIMPGRGRRPPDPGRALRSGATRHRAPTRCRRCRCAQRRRGARGSPSLCGAAAIRLSGLSCAARGRRTGATLQQRGVAGRSRNVELADGTTVPVSAPVVHRLRPGCGLDRRGGHAGRHGRPLHHAGASPVPGLHCAGLPWQTRLNFLEHRRCRPGRPRDGAARPSPSCADPRSDGGAAGCASSPVGPSQHDLSVSLAVTQRGQQRHAGGDGLCVSR